MKLVSLTIARNSSWVIKATISHALKYCDSAVVVLHSSVDDSLKILRGFDNRVTIAKLEDEAWNEMAHRQSSLDIGRELGGTHFVILDDDEILTNNLVPKIRDYIDAQDDGVCLSLPLLSCWRSLDQYRSDPGNAFSKAYKSVSFKDDPDMGWKPQGGYQHHHTEPYNTMPVRMLRHELGGFMHLQHANWHRLVTKQTWYMCMELCRYGKINANYFGTMNEYGLKTSPIARDWWGPEKKLINLNQTPWQLADIKRMIDEKGAEFFIDQGVDVIPYV